MGGRMAGGDGSWVGVGEGWLGSRKWEASLDLKQSRVAAAMVSCDSLFQ